MNEEENGCRKRMRKGYKAFSGALDTQIEVQRSVVNKLMTWITAWMIK
jgi:hypothetical protein